MRKKLLSLLALLCLTVSGAWATEVTIATNQQQTSYTSGDITISVSMVGDGDGAQVSSWCPMTITCGDGNVLQSVVVTIGFYPGNASDVTASTGSCEVSGDGNKHSTYVTVTGINASSVSIGCNGDVQIEQVVVNYGPAGPTVVASGNCGTSGHESDVTWALTSDGVLTISGLGEMNDYNKNLMPWKDLRSSSSATTLITSIVIEDGVTAIGKWAFQGCSKATSISIPNSVTSIGYKAFYSCKKLETIDIPASVTTIESNAFEKCSGLKSVSIPDGVTSISSSAFYGCTSLESIDIPATVTKIESNAFDGCTNLTSINLYTLYTADNCLTLTGTNAFDNCHGDLKIHVFSDYVDAYKTAPTWSSIEDKITPISVTANPDGTGYYWATYYNDLTCATAPEGTQVFKVALSGSTLTLTEISDRVINMGEGVVLKSNSPSITLASAASTGTEAVGGYEGNDLKGTMNSITNPGNAYVLNKTATNGVGFYRLSSEGTIGAHKAYLTYSGGGGAEAREFFLFDEATGIESIDHSPLTIDHSVYDLQGRRVAQPTKGLYIVNGKKVIK